MKIENVENLQNSIAEIIAGVAGPRAESEAREIIEVCHSINAGDQVSMAFSMARKRADGAPIGLVTGRQNFLGIQLITGSEVLVAREETELLGREVIAILTALRVADPDRELRLIDMGCGSGNISCAAAISIPSLRVWASDLTESCAALTRSNVALHSLNNRVEVFQGDLFEPLRGRGLEASMDIVEMNPPYIASTSLEKQKAELLNHEPREAFDGGPFGISIMTRLIREAPAFLKQDGYLLFEFGQGQAKQVRMLGERSKLYSEIMFASDQNGEPRVAIFKR
jgi:release factor glutamine methyltransferase